MADTVPADTVLTGRPVAPIAVALDAPDLATACAWATAVAPHVAVLKVGLETYLRDGAESVAAISEAAGGVAGGPTAGTDSGPALFLDLKLLTKETGDFYIKGADDMVISPSFFDGVFVPDSAAGDGAGTN